MKKGFSLPSQINNWASQLNLTTRFIDLLTPEEVIASEAYLTALDLFDQNKQTFCMTFQASKLMGVKILYCTCS